MLGLFLHQSREEMKETIDGENTRDLFPSLSFSNANSMVTMPNQLTRGPLDLIACEKLMGSDNGTWRKNSQIAFSHQETVSRSGENCGKLGRSSEYDVPLQPAPLALQVD